jgi:hypothetical protein
MMDLPEVSDDYVKEEVDSKKKKKRRKRFVELEYDPEQDVTIYKKKHKRKIDDWDDDWDF